LTPREKININSKRRFRVLIAPLDWGLGHTTRCLPIIKVFQRMGAEIVVACNENQAHLLLREIPGLQVTHINGYGLNYSRSKWMMWIRIIFQIPKILTAIKREKSWLISFLKGERFDLILSDNRFGLRHPSVYSIFLTHQLRIRVPVSSWLENQLQKLNYRFINLFNECWIPDFEGNPNLAGELSHPRQLPQPKLRYLGALSRFAEKNLLNEGHPELAILISGPEPQRTIFENLLINELMDFNGTAVVVRGLPTESRNKEGFRNISFFNHLAAAELNELLGNCKFVICRSGYTSIMDIIALRKKSILIPTPGQTEQEYLANYLMEKNWCINFHQKNFSLQKALAYAQDFAYADLHQFKMDQFEIVIQDFMQEQFKEILQPDASREN